MESHVVIIAGACKKNIGKNSTSTRGNAPNAWESRYWVADIIMGQKEIRKRKQTGNKRANE